MLNKFIGQKCRIIIYKDNQIVVDMICKELDHETIELFNKYKCIDYHKTEITDVNVIKLVK